MERLGQEALHLACTSHGQLVFLTQLIHTQDGNDVLQVLIGLHQQSNKMSDDNRQPRLCYLKAFMLKFR